MVSRRADRGKEGPLANGTGVRLEEGAGAIDGLEERGTSCRKQGLGREFTPNPCMKAGKGVGALGSSKDESIKIGIEGVSSQGLLLAWGSCKSACGELGY